MAENDNSGDSTKRSETNNLDDSVDSGNNSIIGKVKCRVSSILPNTFSKWFSPSAKISSDLRTNGSLNAQSTTGRRRRIELDDDDDDDGEGVVDDEEAALADNIAEHDLDGEEQTRGDLDIMRLAKVPGHNVDLKDNEDDDEEVEEDINRAPTLSDRSTHNPHHDTNYNIHSSKSSKQPPLKRQRISTELSMRDSPIIPQRRPLVASTPAVSSYLRSNAPNPLTTATSSTRIHNNRYGHMNLYRNQTKREPAYNFSTTTAEPALATSGDLPAVVDANTGLSKVSLSSRRSLNIPSLDSHNFLPKLRRQSLSIVKNTGTPALMSTMPLRTSTAINETIYEQSEELRDTDGFGGNLFANGSATNINNNNNINDKLDVNINRKLLNGIGGVSSHVASLDTASEASNEDTQSHILASSHLNKDNGSRSRTSSVDNMLDFYAHLHGKKSLFSGPQQLNHQQSQAGLASMSALNNSTLSLTSLNRRQFNASIYGSTSALSDSRLLNTFSPFYKGRTTYGGASAYNKYNTTLSASGITSATGAGASFMRMAPTVIRPTSSLSTLSSSNNSLGAVVGTGGDGGEVSGISDTAQRILALLSDFTSPLIDAKRMARNLKEHQQLAKINRLKESDLQTSRSTRNYRMTPYTRNTDTTKLQNGGNKLLQPPTRELIVPKMGMLIELRDFQNTTERLRGIAMEKPNVVEPENCAHKQTNSEINVYNAQQQQQQQQQKYVSKIRPKIASHARITSCKDNALEDETLPQVPLPNLTFPTMQSVPKFDIELPKHIPKTTSTKGIASDTLSTSTKTTIVATSPPIKNFAFNDQLTKTKTNNNSDPTFEELNSEFQFSAPVKYLTELKNLPGVEINFKFSSPKSLGVEKSNAIVNRQIPKPATHLRSGSVLDVLKPMHKSDGSKYDSSLEKSSDSFGAQFKKSANEWECDACMLRNKQDENKCVACETPRVSNNANTKPHLMLQPAVNKDNISITNSFGDKFKKSSAEWECNECMVRNNIEANKCVACETPRKGENIGSLQMPNVPVIANSFGNTFKPKAGTWECSVCLIVNKNNDLECIACQSTKPGSTVSSNATTSSGGLIQEPPKFKFGFAATNSVSTDIKTTNISANSKLTSPKTDDVFKMIAASQKTSKWSCSACFAQNESGRIKCICCEEPKPGTLTAMKSGPTFSFGQTTTKTGNNLEFVNKDKNLSSTANAAVSSTTTPATFGFKFLSSKPLTTTTTSGADSTDASNKISEATGFKFGISSSKENTTSNNSLEEKVPKSVTFNLPTNKSTIVTSTVVEGKSNDMSKPSFGTSFAVAPTVTSATSKASNSVFSLTQPAVLPTATTTANSDMPKSQNTTLGELAYSTSTTSTIASTASTTTTAANAILTSTINFGSGTSSSPISSFSLGSASKLGATVTNNTSSSTITFGSFSKATTATTTTSTAPSTIIATNLFGTVEPSLSNNMSTTAAESKEATNSTITTAPTVTNSFIFGQQASGGVATTTTSSSAQETTNKFIFGPPPMSSTSSTSTSIFSGNSAANSSATASNNNFVFGASNVGGSNVNSGSAASTPSATIIDATKSAEKVNLQTLSHTFGAKLEGKSSFGPTGATTKTAVTSSATSGNVFGSFGGTTSTPTFGSVAPTTTPIFSTGATPASTVSSSSETAGVFGSFANRVPTASTNNMFSTNTAVQPSSTFGGFAAGINHSIGADQSTITVPQATFGNFSTSSANNGATLPQIQTFGGFGAATSATATTAAMKPAFNFGNATTLQNPNSSSGGVFSFGSNMSSAGNNNATTKPAFNFTATNPTVNFNFTNSAAVNSATSDQPANRPFQFGTTFSPAVTPMSMKLFNFGSGGPYAEANTNTSAPFHFNAGAAAPANIFAINPTTTGGSNAQNAQQARRKIRTPTRRLTPR